MYRPFVYYRNSDAVEKLSVERAKHRNTRVQGVINQPVTLKYRTSAQAATNSLETKLLLVRNKWLSNIRSSGTHCIANILQDIQLLTGFKGNHRHKPSSYLSSNHLVHGWHTLLIQHYNEERIK